MEPQVTTRVTVIILTPDITRDITQKCLKNLHTSTEIPFDTVVYSSVGQFNFARDCNDMVKLIRTELFVLLNDDCFPMWGWLEEMMHTVDLDPKIGVVGAIQYLASGGDINHSGGLIIPEECTTTHLTSKYIGVIEFPWVNSALVLVRKKVWEDVGGYSNDFPYFYNDPDFCLRAKELGWKIVVSSGIKAVHYVNYTLKDKIDIPKVGVEDLGRFKKKWSERIKTLDLEPKRYETK